MVEVAQMLDEVVPPCEALVAHARAIFDGAREIRSANAVDRGLVPLQISEPSEIGR
jgi:hypothetical protein